MLLRLKIICVHSLVLPDGQDHGGACAAAPLRRGAAGVARRRRRVTVTMALKEEPESSRSGFAGGGPSWDPAWRSKSPSSKDR